MHVLVSFLGILLLVSISVQAFPARASNAADDSTDLISQVEKEAKVVADPNSTASDLIYVSNQGSVFIMLVFDPLSANVAMQCIVGWDGCHFGCCCVCIILC